MSIPRLGRYTRHTRYVSGSVGLGPIAPENLLNLNYHYDFSDSSSVTLSGSDIDAIANKASDGDDSTAFADGALTTSPVLESSVQNSLDVARFTGSSNDRLILDKPGSTPTTAHTDMFRDVSAATVTIVFRNNAAVAETLFTVGPNGVNSTRARLRLVGDGTFGIGQRRLDSDSFTEVVDGSFSSNVWSIVVCEWDYASGTVTLWVNGANQIEETSTGLTTGSTSDTTSKLCLVGYDNLSLAQTFDGDIGEIIVHDKKLSASERGGLELHLSQKWNITLA